MIHVFCELVSNNTKKKDINLSSPALGTRLPLSTGADHAWRVRVSCNL